MAKEERNREKQLNKLMKDMKVSKGSEVSLDKDSKLIKKVQSMCTKQIYSR